MTDTVTGDPAAPPASRASLREVLFCPAVLVVFAVGIVLFGAAHRYQGWTGIGASAAVGVLMTVVLLATGGLVAAMLLHALIDLNAVVLRPIVSGRFSSSAATRS